MCVYIVLSSVTGFVDALTSAFSWLQLVAVSLPSIMVSSAEDVDGNGEALNLEALLMRCTETDMLSASGLIKHQDTSETLCGPCFCNGVCQLLSLSSRLVLTHLKVL